jgi:Mg-chelatase subunit ChlD
MNRRRRLAESLALLVCAGCAANPGVGSRQNSSGAGRGGDAGGAGASATAGTSGVSSPFITRDAGSDSGTAGPPVAPGLNAAAVLRGSCATSTVQSQLLPANILFVLDRSGSMACNPPPTTDSPTCEAQPTRASASKASKWEITTAALLGAIKNLPASASVGLTYFSNDDACGVTSTPSVSILPNTQAQQDAIEKNMKSVSPGGGTPIVGATILAYKHMHESALAGKLFGNEFVVLITDGAQSEMCSFAPSCTDAASCVDLLVNQEVPKAAGPGVGIRTFVIGVPGSEPARTVLSQIAQKGGTGPDGCDPQQGNCHFDMTMVTDLGPALSKALMEISGQTINCELDVPQPATGELDINLVNVVYSPSDGSAPRVLRQDAHAACDAGADGWQYADGNRKIRLCGQTCDSVRSDGAARVDVVIGCPVLGVQ